MVMKTLTKFSYP